MKNFGVLKETSEHFGIKEVYSNIIKHVKDSSVKTNVRNI